MKKIIESRLAKLPPKVALPLKHLAKIGQMREEDIKTVLDAGDITGNPHTLVGFAAGAMGMKAQRVPVADTVAMAKKLGRTIRLDWSPRRWREEHDRIAKAVTLRQFRKKNVNYDVEFYAKSLPPEFPGYIIRNSLRLATVGWYQRHCVASYHSSCASGSSAIVCVFVDHTRWTVELRKTENPDYPIRITQIRTTDNRGPDPQTEQKIYEHLGIPEQVREIPEYIQRNREQCLLRNVTIVNLSRVHEALAKAGVEFVHLHYDPNPGHVPLLARISHQTIELGRVFWYKVHYKQLLIARKKGGLMNAQCTTTQLEFQPYGHRNVTARFDGGRISSDAGALLLREVDTRLGLVDRVGKCFRDYRDPRVTEHSVRELVAQRIFALAMGYEDLNDHDELRQDSVLAMLVGKSDLIGKTRPRSRDRGYPLASSSTLNRLELGDPEKAPKSRNKRIVGDLKALDRLFVDVFIESFDQAPKEIWLDLDATDDLLHGSQEQRFYHGYYKNYCYLPLYIFCGEHLLDAQLRPSNQDASAGSEAELTRIVGHIRQHWPATKIVIRADSGFCRDAILTWCENNRVDYVVGVARNDRLVQAIDRELQQAKRACHKSGEAARVFKDFTYRTRETWSRERRVVGKAEYLPKGANPRFVVTSLSCERVAAQPLYEELYCARGDMENRIKEQQLGLFADRTSCSVFRANELRLKFSSLAYVLMHGLRRLGLTGTRFARAQCTTIRLKLFKVAARVRMTVRKVWLSFAESYPYQGDIVRILAQLRRHAAWVPPD